MKRIVLVALVACSKSSAAILDDKTILGAWEVWCATEKEVTASCRGKDDHGLVKTFTADHRIALSGGAGGPPMLGTWKLDGSTLSIEYAGGGMTLHEKYRARLEDGRLVLWGSDRGFGSVLGRSGEFEGAATQESSGDATHGTISGVDYTIALPPHYRLARDDHGRQRWEPASGEGLRVDLVLGNSAQSEVNGKWVTPPCEPSGVQSSGARIDGVDRDTSIGISICRGDKYLSCSAEHTRGYLEAADKGPGLALCKSLSTGT